MRAGSTQAVNASIKRLKTACPVQSGTGTSRPHRHGSIGVRSIATSSRLLRYIPSRSGPSASSAEPSPSPLNPSSTRPKVAYSQEKTYASSERRSFFQDGSFSMQEGLSGGVGERDLPPELVPGRVVECRRSHNTTLGLILATIWDNDRPRLLLLRSNGEIWPVSATDVQFIMPSSLISPDLVDRCWSPELLQAMGRQQDVLSEELLDADMLSARRQVTMTLRKVAKETEKMSNRFASKRHTSRPSDTSRGVNSEVGKGEKESKAYTGVQAVWDAFASDQPAERGSITAVQAAQFLFGRQSNGTLPVVRPSTLPAYAAHDLLMANPHYFLAGERNMWDNGQFMVRSREEVERIRRVEAIVTRSTPDHSLILDGFVRKIKAALDARLAGETLRNDWSTSERELLHALAMKLYETRATQVNPYDRISTIILRSIDPYPGEAIDEQLIARVLQDAGVLPQCDTLTTSKAMEAVCRTMNMLGVATTESGVPSASTGELRKTASTSHSSSLPGDLRRGDELDTLRTDYSSHRVWVIDDASASELDDGISFTRIDGSDDVWVHVHIADPTSIIPLDHPIARRASIAGSALYLPEGNTPLFPLPDVMSRFSLGAAHAETSQTSTSGKGQSVLTISARLGSDGTFSESKVELGYIDNARLTTYRAVDEAMGRMTASDAYQPFGVPTVSLDRLDGDRAESRERLKQAKAAPITPAEQADLDLLFSLAKTRRRHRLRSAGFDFTSHRGDSTLASSGAIRPVTNMFASPTFIPASANVPGPAEDVYIKYTVHPGRYADASAASAVSEIMLLAGRVCADWCAQRGIAIPYRGGMAPIEVVRAAHEGPGMSLAELLAHKDENGLIDSMLVRRASIAFVPGTIDSNPLEHWQLGLTGADKGYTRATSPLRRFDDFLVHSQIKAYLAQQQGITSCGKVLRGTTVLSLAKPSEDAQRRNKFGSSVAQAYWLSTLVRSRLADPSARGYAAADASRPLIDLAKPLTGVVLTAPTPLSAAGVGSGSRVDVEVPELQAVVELELGGSARYGIGEEVSIRIVDAKLRPKPLLKAVVA